MSKTAIGTDREIVEQCIGGDEGAWRRLVLRHECLVFSVALRTGLDREAASDVFQQVWMELHRSLARLRDPDALAKWLTVTTRRRAYRYALVHAKQVEGVCEEMVDPSALPDARVEALEARQKIEDGLQLLGEPCASVIRLLFLQPEKSSYKEVSQRAGVAMGSIGPIRARCLSRLRNVMKASEMRAEE